MFVSTYLTDAKIDTRDDFPYFSYDFPNITGVSTLNLFNFFPTIIMFSAHYPPVFFLSHLTNFKYPQYLYQVWWRLFSVTQKARGKFTQRSKFWPLALLIPIMLCLFEGNLLQLTFYLYFPYFVKNRHLKFEMCTSHVLFLDHVLCIFISTNILLYEDTNGSNT